jgi:hypothetical protein
VEVTEGRHGIPRDVEADASIAALILARLMPLLFHLVGGACLVVIGILGEGLKRTLRDGGVFAGRSPPGTRLPYPR